MRAYLGSDNCAYIYVDGVTIPFASPKLPRRLASFDKENYVYLSGCPAKAFSKARPFRKVKLSQVFMW